MNDNVTDHVEILHYSDCLGVGGPYHFFPRFIKSGTVTEARVLTLSIYFIDSQRNVWAIWPNIKVIKTQTTKVLA